MRQILVSVVLVTLMACGGNETETSQITEGLEAEAEVLGSDPVGSGFQTRFGAWMNQPGDPVRVENDNFNVDSVVIEGNDLLVRLMHGGGCKKHEYVAAWNGEFRESAPVQVDFEVKHDANEDLCRAILRPTLRIPLEPLRDAYRAAYRTESGTIVIGIEGSDASIVDQF